MSRVDPLDALELSLRRGAAELYVVRHADAVPEANESFTIYDDYEAHPLSARGRSQAEAVASRLAASPLRVEARAGEGGKLFGSVTNADVADALRNQTGIEVDRRSIDLAEPIKELGAAGMFPPIKTSCLDHEGSGMVKFQEWDGKGFKSLTPYMAGDRDMVRKMVEESAAKYAAEKKVTVRDCGKEG